MKKRIKIAYIPLLLLLVILLQQACTYNHLPESAKTILLNWYPAPANQSKVEFTTGLVWLFSYLGATVPKDKFSEAIIFGSSNRIEVNIEALGFSSNAVKVLEKLIAIIKQTEEYKITGGIDAGRFFALCFNSTYQYYQITTASKTYNEFSLQYANFAFKTFVCDSSAISPFSRIFHYTISETNIQKNCFVSEEGTGRYTNGNFVKSGFIEAFDYMENGQPRFVIYDTNGMLYVPKNSSEHPAGKPSKCMWCHESGMQPLFTSTTNIQGFVSTSDFLNDQKIFTSNLENFHTKSSSVLNFKDKKAHNQAEYIYLCFYEPNAARLATEWGMTEEAVENLLSGVLKHTNPEFPFLKDVYHRYEIEKFAPYKSIEVSQDMREASLLEPNYLQQ
jgi:hypothetical protein